MYLGQWGAAALRLLLPLIAVGLAILGILDVLPFSTFSLAVITLICALIWEALDLARIDRDVAATNAALMDRLLATLPTGSSFSFAPERPAIPSEPLEPPTQPDVARAAVADAGMAGVALGAAAAFTPSIESIPPAPSTPESSAPVPTPEPALTPLTFAPEPVPTPGPTPASNYLPVSQERAIPPSEPSTATLPPTASAYVPPVAPEIVIGGFGAAPESPPIWPSASHDAPSTYAAPEWPGVATTPDAPTSSMPTADETNTQTQQAIPQGQPEAAASPVGLEDIATTGVTPFAGAASYALQTAHIPDPAPAPPVAKPPTQPEAPKLKHIRVRRKIMLDDGTVVGEQVLEDDFPVEMDTQDAAKILEGRFQQMSLEEIARQANLPPGTELQLKRE